MDVAHIEIASTAPSERALAPTPLRLVRRIEPTDPVVEAAALAVALVITARTGEDGSGGLTILLEVPRAG